MDDQEKKYPLEFALQIAQKLKAQLVPHCERVEIAGSIRRKKAFVKDIEIVAIPKPYQVGLFSSGIAEVIKELPKIKGDLPGKYVQRMLPEGIKLDLFIAEPMNWGWIYLLRIGSSDFNQFKVLRWLREAGFTAKGGMIYQIDYPKPLWVPEEHLLFEKMGIPFVKPEDRNYIHPMK